VLVNPPFRETILFGRMRSCFDSFIPTLTRHRPL
jgi:hypothetical protein